MTAPFDLEHLAGNNSDAVAVMVYADAPQGDWGEAIGLLIGGSGTSDPVMQMTSHDGLSTTKIACRDFSKVKHDEDRLAISVDWYLSDGDIDGYVFGSLWRVAGVRLESFTFGPLGERRGAFLHSLKSRFGALCRSSRRPILGLDVSGESSDDDWLRFYSGAAAPATAEAIVSCPDDPRSCPHGMHRASWDSYFVFMV